MHEYSELKSLQELAVDIRRQVVLRHLCGTAALAVWGLPLLCLMPALKYIDRPQSKCVNTDITGLVGYRDVRLCNST